jgi:hypothetical protein
MFRSFPFIPLSYSLGILGRLLIHGHVEKLLNGFSELYPNLFQILKSHIFNNLAIDFWENGIESVFAKPWDAKAPF